MTTLNTKLLKQQNVTKEQEQTLVLLYISLEDILNNPEEYQDPVTQIEQIEYQLQENWNFKKDSGYHSYWNKLKGCTCPILDNNDLWGTDMRVYNNDCKWHGDMKNE